MTGDVRWSSPHDLPAILLRCEDELRELDMAVVERFQRSNRYTFRLQPTLVVCHYAVFKRDDGKQILQLDTLGSAAREKPGKVSQTLQLDEAQAKVLWVLLDKEFKFSHRG